MMASDAEARLAGVSTLLQLERDARHADTPVALGFLIVNETRKLIPYLQAHLWDVDDGGRVRIISASGTSEVDPHAPLIVWLHGLLKLQNAAGIREIREYSAKDVDESLHRDWAEFLPSRILLVPMISPQGVMLGGLLLTSDSGWEEGHRVLLTRLADAYAHAWQALAGERRRFNLRAWISARRTAVILALAALMLFPLRQSVVVPASVGPRHPFVVAAPIDGVIRDVHVTPNQQIRAGDALFSFDQSELDSRVELALKALDVAMADLMKNTQLAYTCDECRSRLPVLHAVVEQKEAELARARSQQERSLVRAEQSGVVVFKDRNELLGRPTSVGERVMWLAETDDSWLEISLPVEDAVNLEPGTDIRFFPNIDPLNAYNATLVYASYEAEVTAQDVLAYSLKAAFAEGNHPRLGLKGTARIYGERVPLVYFLLRRPMAWLRQRVGW